LTTTGKTIQLTSQKVLRKQYKIYGSNWVNTLFFF
jgi:hypothetical protein